MLLESTRISNLSQVFAVLWEGCEPRSCGLLVALWHPKHSRWDARGDAAGRGDRRAQECCLLLHPREGWIRLCLHSIFNILTMKGSQFSSN